MTDQNAVQTFTEAEYVGWIFDNGLTSRDSSGYYPSVESYKREVARQVERGLVSRETRPDSVMGCAIYGLNKISALHIADLSTAELYEAAAREFNLESLQNLQTALDAFYEANAHIQLPVPDWKIKVLIDWGIDAEAIS